jgi:hypothetical protein
MYQDGEEGRKSANKKRKVNSTLDIERLRASSNVDEGAKIFSMGRISE